LLHFCNIPTLSNSLINKIKTLKMKKRMIRTLTVLLMMAMLSITPALLAQDPPPPPPGSHGETGNQSPPGGGVPVGSGLVILLALGAAYGGKKLFDARRRLAE
jgi:hypothetical protein